MAPKPGNSWTKRRQAFKVARVRANLSTGPLAGGAAPPINVRSQERPSRRFADFSQLQTLPPFAPLIGNHHLDDQFGWNPTGLLRRPHRRARVGIGVPQASYASTLESLKSFELEATTSNPAYPGVLLPS